jgi:hypothetical protein
MSRIGCTFCMTVEDGYPGGSEKKAKKKGEQTFAMASKLLHGLLYSITADSRQPINVLGVSIRIKTNFPRIYGFTDSDSRIIRASFRNRGIVSCDKAPLKNELMMLRLR